MLVLKQDDISLDDSLLKSIAKQHGKVPKNDFHKSCVQIAREAIRSEVATGRIGCKTGAVDIVGTSRHSINYISKPGISFIFDLSASIFIDHRYFLNLE